MKKDRLYSGNLCQSNLLRVDQVFPLLCDVFFFFFFGSLTGVLCRLFGTECYFFPPKDNMCSVFCFSTPVSSAFDILGNTLRRWCSYNPFYHLQRIEFGATAVRKYVLTNIGGRKIFYTEQLARLYRHSKNYIYIYPCARTGFFAFDYADFPSNIGH